MANQDLINKIRNEIGEEFTVKEGDDLDGVIVIELKLTIQTRVTSLLLKQGKDVVSGIRAKMLRLFEAKVNDILLKYGMKHWLR